jgi:hypothetical protein
MAASWILQGALERLRTVGEQAATLGTRAGEA